MELNLPQQILALIERSERILLCTHRKPDGDAIGSMMALTRALKLLGKHVTSACADELPESFHFLPGVADITQTVGEGRDFVVTLDCDQTEVDRLKYHLEDNKIHIVITPKQGRFFDHNVSFTQGNEQFDLIISVDVADIPQLGKLYEENRDLFTSIPVINIDHHISNTQFGKVNWIDVSASSTAEMLYRLIRDMETAFGESLVTPEVGTLLLSGITTDTGSFQNSNTTPRSMEIAAELMEAGANQQDIIKYLFRTKKLQTLKLYGKILSKIEVDAKHRMVWSSITQQDLLSSGADMEDASGIIDELMVHAPEAEVVILLKEDPNLISVSLRSTNDQVNVMEIAHHFGGGGHVRAAGAKISNKTLPQVANEVLAFVTKHQKQRLGLPDESNAAPEQPITQVLDGYTPVPQVTPTLEQRSSDMVPSTAPVPVSAAPTTALKPMPQDRTRAAISDEQSKPSETLFKPSEAIQQTRQRPQPEKRFTDELPNFMIPPTPSKPTFQAPASPPVAPTPPPSAPKPSTPPPQKNIVPPPQPVDPQPVPKTVFPTQTRPTPPAPPTSDTSTEEGVTVRIAKTSQPTPSPEIPADSSEPVVKTVSPPVNTKSFQDVQDVSSALSGFGASTTRSVSAQPETDLSPPEAPKDPFALGDDGLTDIERALGGL